MQNRHQRQEEDQWRIAAVWAAKIAKQRYQRLEGNQLRIAALQIKNRWKGQRVLQVVGIDGFQQVSIYHVLELLSLTDFLCFPVSLQESKLDCVHPMIEHSSHHILKIHFMIENSYSKGIMPYKKNRKRTEENNVCVSQDIFQLLPQEMFWLLTIIISRELILSCIMRQSLELTVLINLSSSDPAFWGGGGSFCSMFYDKNNFQCLH